MNGGLLLAGALVFIPMGIFIIIAIISAQRDKKRWEFGDMGLDGYLFVKKRGQSWGNLLRIVDDKNYTISYKPEEYIYTSATVGGITTGGVTKIGGYNYVSNVQKTGKYQLRYAGKTVERIVLTKELRKQAKNSQIAEYLNADGNIEVISSVASSRTQLLMSGLNSSVNMKTVENSLAIDRSKGYGYPTYEKCIAIMNWLSGID